MGIQTNHHHIRSIGTFVFKSFKGKYTINVKENLGYTRHKMKTNKTKTQYVLDTTMGKNPTNNINRTRFLLQTTGGKDQLNIVLCGNCN